jgi:hypothetical protein
MFVFIICLTLGSPLGLWSHGPAKGPSLVFENDAENDGDDQEASDMRLDEACPIPETSDEGRPHHPFVACRKRRWGTTFPPPPQEAMDLEQLQDDDVHASPAAPQEATDLEQPHASDSVQFENDSEQ